MAEVKHNEKYLGWPGVRLLGSCYWLSPLHQCNTQRAIYHLHTLKLNPKVLRLHVGTISLNVGDQCKYC